MDDRQSTVTSCCRGRTAKGSRPGMRLRLRGETTPGHCSPVAEVRNLNEGRPIELERQQGYLV